MAIKQWMSIDQQSEILIKRRHLTANKNELNEILISENYFNFFNGLETIFLPVKYKHHISDKNFGHRHSIEEFKLVYKFDGNLETLISSKLRHFEQRLKTSVAYNFCAHHCYSLNDTMQYTNQDNFVDPACVSQFAFINDQNKDLSRHFNGGAYQEIGSDGTSNNRRYKKFNLFVNKYLDNLVDRNELIKENFYQDDSYFPPQNVAVYHNKPSVAVPFWVSIQYMTFGSMNVLCHFLNDNDIYSVLKDFKIPQDEFHKQVFLNTIDILVSLR
ncbi:Abi family protein, partial [Oenococcus oeni]